MTTQVLKITSLCLPHLFPAFNCLSVFSAMYFSVFLLSVSFLMPRRRIGWIGRRFFHDRSGGSAGILGNGGRFDRLGFSNRLGSTVREGSFPTRNESVCG